MFFAIITLLTALSMATVAAVFAIYGIIAIFAGMPQFALVMGAVIELGKIVGISWLYRNWTEPTKIKYAMAPLVLVAMMLTSMGIFGLLSKAHLEQTSPVANNEIQIERLDQQINREQSRITDAEQVISQLDQSVQALINFDRIRGPDGALAVREGQADQRNLLRQTIDSSQTEVDRLEDQKLELSQQLRAIELEVGPVKYLAELVYGDGADRTEEAVRWVIIAFIFVFDPMAILLLMAANYSLDRRKLLKTAPSHNILVSDPEPTVSPVPEPIKESIVENLTQEPEKVIDLEVLQEPEQRELLTDPSYPSAVDDAAQVIAESAAQKKRLEKQIKTLKAELKKKPKEVIVEKIVEVDGEQLKTDNRSLKKKLVELQKKLAQKPNTVEKIVEVERQVPVEVEKPATQDLADAAKLMARSVLNKEDLTEEEILAILQKSSEDEVRRKLGFWAVPLPKQDDPKTDTNKRYIGKK
jgi:multisubunit Na+/H+ antiporter MnhG subunit